jgi:hypothetical protein
MSNDSASEATGSTDVFQKLMKAMTVIQSVKPPVACQGDGTT